MSPILNIPLLTLKDSRGKEIAGFAAAMRCVALVAKDVTQDMLSAAPGSGEIVIIMRSSPGALI
jgi:hypothetical protein